MKNLIINKNRVVKSVFCIILIAVIALFQSCDTDIPPTDTEPPTFSFKIKGEGFERTFTQDDDFENIQLNLTAGAAYEIDYIGVDAGGLKYMSMEFPYGNFDIIGTLPNDWEDDNNGFKRWFYWNGDSNDPKTGSLISKGTIIAMELSANEGIGGSFYFDLRDYGGQSGSSNQTVKQLNTYLAQHPTEVRYLSK